MQTVQITSTVSFDELLHSVNQLSLPDLEHFVSRTLALLARRKAPSLPKNEAELLLKINQGLPPIVQKRYDELTAKRRSDTIKAEELQELLGLINLIEKSDAERIRNLAQLAHLRQTSLTAFFLISQAKRSMQSLMRTSSVRLMTFRPTFSSLCWLENQKSNRCMIRGKIP